MLNDKQNLKLYENGFKSGINLYFKSKPVKVDAKPTDLTLLNEENSINNNKLTANEKELIKNIATHLNLENEFCNDLYISYRNSSYNQFIIPTDLLERLQFEELFGAHFNQVKKNFH